MELIRKWHSGQKYFTHYTSGSTGRPKKIIISREKIELSVKSTLAFIDPKNAIKSSLLCLSPANIGGAMVVYRAIIFDHDLKIIEPTSNLQQAFKKGQYFDLASMVPLQFKNLSKKDISRFGTILIGGAHMPADMTNYDSNIYATFGMTETVSHIALRHINEELFITTGDTEVAATSDQTLKIKGSITGNKWLITNDIVKIHSNKQFKWIGRADFIINSGGIKINPEMIEAQLMSQIKCDFMAASLPDDKLGRKLVLLIEGGDQKLDFTSLGKYHQPREVFFNQQIFKTKTNKIDRLKTQQYFESLL
ncbi:AMP-binding protein [Ekhidna sp.]|uniref:AMP-binding protein n=1 Tax=Ekhidna sp. TaxID=2608089 RepID=UPI003B5A180D